MGASLKRMNAFVVWLLIILSSARADDRQEAIDAIRASLSDAGNLMIQLSAAKAPSGGGWAPYEDIIAHVKQQPPDLVREATDRAIRQGTRVERIGALDIYSRSVYMKKEPLNPAYQNILLGLLAEDDLQVSAYTGTIVVTLTTLYRSRDTVLTIMDAAKRAPTHEERVSLLQSAAYLCGIEWLDIQPESRGPRVEKVLADFESWFAQNRDRIQFTKDGKFRLSGPKPRVDRPELTKEDRERIRQNPACVLRLMNMTFTGEQKAGLSGELNSKCGVALFGTEGAKAMANAALEGGDGVGLSAATQATLSSLAGAYPVVDAGILAAVYVVAIESDSKALELAKETLIQISPADVRRVAKSEPSSVIKKAEALANTSNQPSQD